MGHKKKKQFQHTDWNECCGCVGEMEEIGGQNATKEGNFFSVFFYPSPAIPRYHSSAYTCPHSYVVKLNKSIMALYSPTVRSSEPTVLRLLFHTFQKLTKLYSCLVTGFLIANFTPCMIPAMHFYSSVEEELKC